MKYFKSIQFSINIAFNRYNNSLAPLQYSNLAPTKPLRIHILEMRYTRKCRNPSQAISHSFTHTHAAHQQTTTHYIKICTDIVSVKGISVKCTVNQYIVHQHFKRFTNVRHLPPPPHPFDPHSIYSV